MTVVPLPILAAGKQKPSNSAARQNQPDATQKDNLQENGPNAAKAVKTEENFRADIAGRTATELENGDILIVGGDSAEIYFAAAREFGATGALNTPRTNHSAVRLQDGRVLIPPTANSVRREK